MNINVDELARSGAIINKIRTYYNSKIVGQSQLGVSLLVSMIANGHVLLESVPGLAKTTAAKVMTEAVGGSFSRVQCTPDLLPSDIIGTQTFNMTNNTFETKIGPVYANFLLLDEINRSSAKTQSAMLEAMQERSVSIGGQTYKLPPVFIVIATQNPIEQEGTYELSESHLRSRSTSLISFRLQEILRDISLQTLQITLLWVLPHVQPSRSWKYPRQLLLSRAELMLHLMTLRLCATK